MSRYAILEQIQELDPECDHQRIAFLSTCYDFPFDTIRALDFALFRTFGVPWISALLDRTGEFGHRAQKRYDDTDIIISELLECGYDSDRGQRAIWRMNDFAKKVSRCFFRLRQDANPPRGRCQGFIGFCAACSYFRQQVIAKILGALPGGTR